jgi:cbb3-type cytochrome oxidase subunit 3
VSKSAWVWLLVILAVKIGVVAWLLRKRKSQLSKVGG